MNSKSKDLPLKDALQKLTLRMEAVEKFISFKFGENAIGNVNLVTTKKINKIVQSKTDDYGAKRANNTALKNTLNRRTSSPLKEPPRKRTRSSQRLKKGYTEEDSSNSGEVKEPEGFNSDDDDNMLLIPKREIMDPEYDLQNYNDENDDSMNSMNDLEDNYENHSSDEEPAQEEADDSNLPWKAENYEPPVILDKGTKKHVLVYNNYCYKLCTKPKRNSDGRVCPPEINERQIWRCNNIEDRCCMRIYTKGPEYKVVKEFHKHNHPPRTDYLVRHHVMFSMKKLAETTDQPILEIINNTLSEADEETKLALPKFVSMRAFLRRARQRATGQIPVRNTPCFNHIINKLKQGDTAKPKSNKKAASKSESSTNISLLVSPAVANKKESSTLLSDRAKSTSQDYEFEGSPLLIPKTEVPCFDDSRDKDDGDTEVENGIADEYLPAEDNINAPFLQEGYEPPFVLEKGSKRLLVYQGYTYCLSSTSKTSLDEFSGVVIRERQEKDKKIWRCSCNSKLKKTENNSSPNCLARIYTWGPELKVLGFLGEHCHVPRTEEIQKLVYMTKLREIALTTDTPINNILEECLQDVPEELKSILPKVSSLKHYLGRARIKRRKPHVKNRITVYERIKQLKGTPDKTNPSLDSTQNLGASTSYSNNSMLNNKSGELGGSINDGDECPNLDDDAIAPWMMPDYVAPLVLPSNVAGDDGIVLAFKGYIYYSGFKGCSAKEQGKRNWRCSCNNEEGEKCKARMYTFGQDYKVVGFWGEHNHPPREDKIEARRFMEELKEMARTNDAPLSEIVRNAIADKSEQFIDILPKLESIYSVLRRARSKCGMYTKKVRKTNAPKRPPRKKVRKTNTEEFNLSDYFQVRF